MYYNTWRDCKATNWLHIFVGLRQNTLSVAQHVIKGDQTYTDI